MKVYIVISYIPYEGQDIRKVFSDEEKAIKWMEYQDGLTGLSHVIEEHEIE